MMKTAWNRRVAGVCAALCLAGQASARSTPEAPLPWGAKAEQSACPDTSSYLWVSHEGGKDCMRYFSGGALQGAKQVVVLLHGDRDGALGKKPEDIRNNTRQAQEAYAAKQAEAAGLPFLVLARPGTYGASGDHRQRRDRAEFTALGAAMDALKQRYGIQRFVMLGHSGGATAIAALMTLGRTDIDCAVMSSGAYHYLARTILWRMRDKRPLVFDKSAQRIAGKYDPIEYVDKVAADDRRKVYILGDPRDDVTPFHLQALFAWEMLRHGHHAEVVSVPGQPPRHHNLKPGSVLGKAMECVRSG